MSRKPKTAIVQPTTQSERFASVAHELGCDEDEAAFKAKPARIARQKLNDEPVAPKGKSVMRFRKLGVILGFVVGAPTTVMAEEPSGNTVCFEISTPATQQPPYTPVLLNKCSGATWLLVRVAVPDVPGRPANSFSYVWQSLRMTDDPPILSYNLPPPPTNPKPPSR